MAEGSPTTVYTLYRIYNTPGDLLYVGMSRDVLRRLTQHAAGQRWFGDIAFVTCQHFGSRKEAMAAEAQAISNEHPTYNVHHNGTISRNRALGWEAIGG